MTLLIGNACESREAAVAAHVTYGMGDVMRLERPGVPGPELLLHMGWVRPKELMLLQKRDVKISLAPGATFHQAMGNISHGRTPEMLEPGFAASLGSGSAMWGKFLDAIFPEWQPIH